MLTFVKSHNIVWMRRKEKQWIGAMRVCIGIYCSLPQPLNIVPNCHIYIGHTLIHKIQIPSIFHRWRNIIEYQLVVSLFYIFSLTKASCWRWIQLKSACNCLYHSTCYAFAFFGIAMSMFIAVRHWLVVNYSTRSMLTMIFFFI